MASPRADSISSPQAKDRAASKGFAGSTKKKAVGSPNLRPPPKYEMPEDWPVEGPIDLNQVCPGFGRRAVLHATVGVRALWHGHHGALIMRRAAACTARSPARHLLPGVVVP